MASYFIIECALSNQGPLAYKIGCLANPIKNSVLTALITVLVVGYRLRGLVLAAQALSSLCLIGEHSTLLALTNTFFTIHPVLLYAFTSLAVCSVAFTSRRVTAAYIGLWALSIAMGGFWSMQELSWGGWWNWDVIECGVAYQWFLAAYLAHRSYRSLCWSVAASFGVGLSALSYTTLNKLGVGVSIHSFVTSASVQHHYCSVASLALLFCLSAASRGLSAPAYYAAVLFFFYCGTRSFNIAKPALVWAALLTPQALSRRPALIASHALVYWITGFVLAANYLNTSFFYSYSPHKLAATLSRSGQFWSIDIPTPGRQKLIWDELWLSKPRYCYFWSLESWSTRSPVLRSTYSAFFK